MFCVVNFLHWITEQRFSLNFEGVTGDYYKPDIGEGRRSRVHTLFDKR